MNDYEEHAWTIILLRSHPNMEGRVLPQDVIGTYQFTGTRSNMLGYLQSLPTQEMVSLTVTRSEVR